MKLSVDAKAVLKQIEQLKLSKEKIQQEKADLTAELKVREAELKKIDQQMKETFSKEELSDLDALKESLAEEAEKLLTKLNKE